MAEPNVRDTKLIQYLNEAYGKEKELEVALQAHIAMTTRPPVQEAPQGAPQGDQGARPRGPAAHQAARRQGRGRERARPRLAWPRPPSKVAEVASKGLAAAKGPLHAIRGTGENEKMLKNAKTEYWNEFEEIATYSAIESLAESVGDKDTAKLAKSIRREEERMAKFLEKQIPSLAKGVATEEIPAAERRRTRARRRRPARRPLDGAQRATASPRPRSAATATSALAPASPRPRAATARPARPASRPARAPASARPASRIASCVPAHGGRLAPS